MRKLLTLICFVISVVTNAQEWTDFTDVLFTNAKFENGSTDGWYVSSKPKEKTDGAVGFSAGSIFYMYQDHNTLLYEASIQHPHLAQ